MFVFVQLTDLEVNNLGIQVPLKLHGKVGQVINLDLHTK